MSDLRSADDIEIVVDEVTTDLDRCVTGYYKPSDTNNMRFNSWDEVAVYAAEQCDDGITLEDFKDACDGIEYPAQRIEGFVMTIDGNAGLSCEDLQRIAEYKESRQ